MENYSFDLPKHQSNVIKVIGVGGGGSNAVNHMYTQGIKGVDYVICNTDSQALSNSNVVNKIQLGVSLTEGLGAGADPDIGKQAAEESTKELDAMLDVNTKMVFITAGMGGGTGTGAAPIIAKLSKDKGILTVGIVTIPFTYEGKKRSEQAQRGVEKLRENVDSLIVINNNKLSEIYGDLGFKAGYAKADEVLATAAKGIAEVISKHYIQNIDLRDAKTVLAEGGTAIMGSAVSSGSERAKEAVVGALNSPLLNDNKIIGAQKVLLLIVFGTEEITHSEVEQINMYIQNEAGNEAEIIMGVGEDESLGDSISVTVIATGFDPDQETRMVNTDPRRIIHTLNDEQVATHDLSPKKNKPYRLEDFNDERISSSDNRIITSKRKEENPIFSIEVDYEVVHPEDFVLIEEEKETKKMEAAPRRMTRFDSFEGRRTLRRNEDIIQQSFDFDTKHQSSAKENRPLSTPFRPETSKSPESNSSKKTYYSLQDYNEVEESLSQAKSTNSSFEIKKETHQETEIAFELRRVDEKRVVDIPEETEEIEDFNPLNSPIAESLKKTTEQRKKAFKKYNYQFGSSSSIDDREKPAYLRQGIALDDISSDSKISRSSLAEDSNGELQIRQNNSYLYDNAD